MALSRRQRARLVHIVTSAVPVVVLVIVVFAADWAAIQQAFFQPEIAADLFPAIITVGVKNTLIYTTLAFIGGPAHRAPDRAHAAVDGEALPLVRVHLHRAAPRRPAIVTLIAVGFAVPIALDFRVPGKYGTGRPGAGPGRGGVHGRDDPGRHPGGAPRADGGGPLARHVARPGRWSRS